MTTAWSVTGENGCPGFSPNWDCADLKGPMSACVSLGYVNGPDPVSSSNAAVTHGGH